MPDRKDEPVGRAGTTKPADLALIALFGIVYALSLLTFIIGPHDLFALLGRL